MQTFVVNTEVFICLHLFFVASADFSSIEFKLNKSRDTRYDHWISEYIFMALQRGQNPFNQNPTILHMKT